MANTSIRVDTVGLGIAFSLGETYRVAIDEGFLFQSDGLKLPIAGNTSIMSFSTPANPPQIANTIPTHTSTAPIGVQTVNFTIDRSEGNLTVLGGNVFLNRQGSPNVVVKTFAVSNINTTGNTVSFSVVGNLEASQTYFITSNANIFLDRDGFKNNAITNSSSYRFVSPTAPVTTTFSPGAPANPNFTEIFAGFDRTIFSNSGNLFLHNANTNAVVRTYNISSALISNNSIVLDIVGNIAGNVYYYVSSNANVVMDSTQIKYPGFTNPLLWAFQAPTNPFITSTTPAINANVSRTTTGISFTLDRTVTTISGNVYLYNRATPNILLKTWTIGSNVTFNNDKVFSVVIPQGMLAPTQNYFVSTDANIARDLTHINYLGIRSNTAYSFSTGEAPLLSSTNPSYGQAADENNTNVSFIMDRVVTKNTGNFYLYKIDIVNGNSLIKTYNINSNVYLTGNDTISIPISNTLNIMEKYYISSDYDVLQDYYTNEKYQGIIDANTFVFTTAVDRSYVVDRTAVLFPNNIPQITETDTGATYIVSLQLSSAIGQIQANGDNFASPTGWTAGTRTYSVTGSKTTVNSALSNLYFFPFANTSSSATLTYSVTKNSVFQKSLVFAITSSANPGYLTGGGSTYTIAEDSKFNFMPFYVYPSWNSNCVVMLKSVDASTGNVVTSAGTFNANTASGWTSPNDGVIYKAFSQPANIAVYNSQVAEVRDIYYWLASDYTANVKIDLLLGIESTRSGNILSGGTVYSVSNNYTITPSGEYNLVASTSYNEDTLTSIDLQIIDADVHGTYNVAMTQISPDPGLVTGYFVTPGYPSGSYGSVSDTQLKATWTNALSYVPPADYLGNITLGLTLTKIQSGKANITMASNVAITLTNQTASNEYTLPLSGVYNEDVIVTFDYDIIDADQSNPTYYVTFNQISPDPATNPMDFIRDETIPYADNYTSYGNTIALSGSKSYIINATKGFYPPVDYSGNIVFGFTQIKSSYNGNITQASNIAITYTNSASHDDYSVTTAGLYSEDNNIVFTANITDTDSRFTSYYLTFNQISPDPATNPANVYIGNVNIGTNGTIYNTRTYLNSQIKQIVPPADWTDAVIFGYTQKKSTTYAYGNVTQASNVAMTFNNNVTHSEYSITTPYILESQIATLLGNNFVITDQAQNKNYSVTINATNLLGNLYVGNVLQSKSVTYIGTKTSVNANIANLIILADHTISNVSANIYYTQSQTTDSILQANAVPIVINTTKSSYYTIPSSLTLAEPRSYAVLAANATDENYLQNDVNLNRLANIIISNSSANVTVTITQNPVIGYFRFGTQFRNAQYPLAVGFDDRYYNPGNIDIGYGNSLSLQGNAYTISSELSKIAFYGYTGSNANVQTTTFTFTQTNDARNSTLGPLGNITANSIQISTSLRATYEIGDYIPAAGGYFFGYYAPLTGVGVENVVTHMLIASPKSAEFNANILETSDTINVNDANIAFPGYATYRGPMDTMTHTDGLGMTDWWYTTYGNSATAATTVKSLTVNGHSDWYIPSLGEMVLMHAVFKPSSSNYSDWGYTLAKNYNNRPFNNLNSIVIWPNDGMRPDELGGTDVESYNRVWKYNSSIRTWYNTPQTPITVFQSGNSQALSGTYLTSTYGAVSIAYSDQSYPFVGFPVVSNNGIQDGQLLRNGSNNRTIRPVRRHPI